MLFNNSFCLCFKQPNFKAKRANEAEFNLSSNYEFLLGTKEVFHFDRFRQSGSTCSQESIPFGVY